jgi:hypothetical protein
MPWLASTAMTIRRVRGQFTIFPLLIVADHPYPTSVPFNQLLRFPKRRNPNLHDADPTGVITDNGPPPYAPRHSLHPMVLKIRLSS